MKLPVAREMCISEPWLSLQQLLNLPQYSSRLANVEVTVICKVFALNFTFKGYNFLHFSIGFALVLFALFCDYEKGHREDSTSKLLIQIENAFCSLFRSPNQQIIAFSQTFHPNSNGQIHFGHSFHSENPNVYCFTRVTRYVNNPLDDLVVG